MSNYGHLIGRYAGTALPPEYEYTTTGQSIVRRIDAFCLVIAGAAALVPFASVLSHATDPSESTSAMAVSLFVAVILAIGFVVASGYTIRHHSWFAAAATISFSIFLGAATASPHVFLALMIGWAFLVAAVASKNVLVATRPITPTVDDRLLTQRVIGQPGIGLMSEHSLRESGMDVEALRKGMIGEQLSGELFIREIERSELTPYIQIVHGLKYPGSTHADIDHALVCANRVLLVDSKYWQAVHWRWFGDAMIGGTGEHQQVRESGFTHGVAMVRQKFHPVEVGAAVLLHPSGEGTITVDNSMAGSHPPLVPASEGIAPLLGWLRGALPPTQDEYRRLQSQSMRMVLSITD